MRKVFILSGPPLDQNQAVFAAGVSRSVELLGLPRSFRSVLPRASFKAHEFLRFGVI